MKRTKNSQSQKILKNNKEEDEKVEVKHKSKSRENTKDVKDKEKAGFFSKLFGFNKKKPK